MKNWRRFLAVAVLSLSTLISARVIAQSPNGGYSSPASGSGSSGGSANFGPTIINPTDAAYGVKADVVRMGDCSWTAGSNPTTVTCPDGLFTSSMTSKGCQGTSGTSYLAAAFGTFTYISSTQGTCSGGVGVGSPSGTGQFAVGTDDTAAWTAVGNALIALPNCGTVLIPSGNSFLGAAVGNTTKAGCTTSPGSYAGAAVGTSVRGQGRSTSVLIMREGFDFSGCINALGCFMQGGSNGTEYKGFTFDGMNAGLSGTTITFTPWMTVTNAGGLQDVGFVRWAQSATSTFTVLDCAAQGGYCDNYQIDFFGNSSVRNTGSGSFTRTSFNDGKYDCGASSACYDTGTFVGAGVAAIPTNNNSIMITLSTSGVNYFTDTTLQGIGSNSAAVICGTGCTGYLTNFLGNPGSIGGTNIGLDITGTGIIYLKNSLIAGGSGGAVAGTGTLVNLGGNNSTAGPWTFTGTYTDQTGTFSGAKCTGVATAASTLGLYGTGPNETATTCTSTTIGSGIIMSKAGKIFELLAKATAGGVNASSGAVTVLKNGVAQSMTCTIGTGTSCIDGATAHVVTVAKGDLISIQFTTQTAETLAGVSADLVIW